MRTIYVLRSNDWLGYYQSEETRDADYASQDYCFEFQVEEKDFKQFTFEDEQRTNTGNT